MSLLHPTGLEWIQMHLNINHLELFSGWLLYLLARHVRQSMGWAAGQSDRERKPVLG